MRGNYHGTLALYLSPEVTPQIYARRRATVLGRYSPFRGSIEDKLNLRAGFPYVQCPQASDLEMRVKTKNGQCPIATSESVRGRRSFQS